VESWSRVASRATPEDVLMAKERAGLLWRALGHAQEATYKPSFDTTRCGKGHVGQTFFVIKRRGNVSRACRVCHRDAVREYKRRTRARRKRQEGGQASEGL
jgi:hypothetical protein